MINFTVNKKIAVIGSLQFPQPMGIGVEYYNIYNQKPKTWESKFNLLKSQIDGGDIDGVIIYLATPLFLQSSKPEYYQIWKDFLSCLGKTKTLVIAFEENIHENFDYYDYDEQRFLTEEEVKQLIITIENAIKEKQYKFKIEPRVQQLIEEEAIEITESGTEEEYYSSISYLERKLINLQKALERIEDYKQRHEQVRLFIEDLLQSEINLSTFKEKKVIGYRIETFLEEILKDIFFSVYVPKEQFFAEEFEEFLKIFEKYLQQIEGVNFTVDSQTSFNGTKYYFKSKGKKINLSQFPSAVKRFNDFIELCIINPDAAMELLKEKFPDPTKALQIIQDYTKKYNRLSIDLKHQQQRLQLMMKQDIENSLLEISIHGTASLIFDETNLIKESISHLENGLTMPSFVRTNGRYTQEDIRIIEIATKYGEDKDIVFVKSSIELLKDKEVSQSERQTATDKLKTFLIKAGKKALKHAEDIGVKVLIAYLENKTKGL